MDILPFCDQRDPAKDEEQCAAVKDCLEHGPQCDRNVTSRDSADDAVEKITDDRDSGKKESLQLSNEDI